MAQEQQRWDPSSPGFVTAVLRTMIGLFLIVILLGILRYRAGIWGLLSGGALAMILYLTAMHAGRVFVRTKNYTRTMLWLMLSQVILWVGMALLLAVVKVNPIGFILGVSVMPAAIILTLVWYHIRKRRLPS